MKFSPIRLSAAAAFISLLTAASSQAALTLYDSQGFQSADFVNNASLEGQDVGHGPWVITANPNPAQANIRSNVGVGGTAGVEVIAGSGQTSTGWYVSKPVAPTSPLNTVNVDFNMAYVPTNVSGLTYGPFFGVELYDASAPGPAKQIGAFGVDSSTGDLLVLIDDNGTPTFSELLTPTQVAGGAQSFNHYGISIDYVNQAYTVLLNGVALETNSFVDLSATAFTDAPISTRFISFGGEESFSAGSAYFDDYVVTLVPEPGTAAALSGVLLAVCRRRR